MAVKGPKNCIFTYASVNMTAYVDQVDLNMAVNELETTNLDSTGQEFIPGLPSYDSSIKITKWDKVIDDVLGAQGLVPVLSTAAIAFKDASGDTITYTWTSNAFITGYSIAGAATGKVDGSAKFRLSGIPSRAAS